MLNQIARLCIHTKKLASSQVRHGMNASELQEALEYIRQKRAQEGASGQPSTEYTESED